MNLKTSINSDFILTYDNSYTIIHTLRENMLIMLMTRLL